MAKVQVLEVFLGGPRGRVWTERFDKIAAARVKHYAERNEFQPGTDQYKRLVTFSNVQAEVEDWARRFVAPEVIRQSWYHCNIAVKEMDESTLAEVQESQESQWRRTQGIEDAPSPVPTQTVTVTKAGR